MSVSFAKGLSEREKLQAELIKIKEEMLRKAHKDHNRKREFALNKNEEDEQKWKLAGRPFNRTNSVGRKGSCGEKDSEKSNIHKRPKKSKEKKSKHKRQKDRRSRKSSSDTEEEDFCRSKTTKRVSNKDTSTDKQMSKIVDIPLAREEWMINRMLLPTYSKDKKVAKNDKECTTYDPCKSSKELNPYWKNEGNGIPPFKIPGEMEFRGSYDGEQLTAKRNWKKPILQTYDNDKLKAERPLQIHEEVERNGEVTNKTLELSSLQDKDLNKLGAQILKAEMMGDLVLVKTLKEKLEFVKNQRKRTEAESKQEMRVKSDLFTNEDHILLSTTDEYGVVRPLPPCIKNTMSISKGRKRNSTCERAGYPDDDRYDLKNMFETEKHATSSSSNAEFLEMISRQKRNVDDMDDIFVDQIQKTNKNDNKGTETVIREYEKFGKILDSCDKCFFSMKLDREFIVSEGSYIYLAIPWHEGLQRYHCLIVPKEHISCSTRLDENVWSEITAFRKALCRAFENKKEQCIFFEVAVNLHKKPHCVIHCIPGQNFEEMPLYFKKAILESEKDWSINKQLITLKEKDVRDIIPKELPYFWVNFGMESGFAHVIEDQRIFPVNFAQEIIGNFLELNPNQWRRPRKEQNHLRKVEQFVKVWKNCDVTGNIESK